MHACRLLKTAINRLSEFFQVALPFCTASDEVRPMTVQSSPKQILIQSNPARVRQGLLLIVLMLSLFLFASLAASAEEAQPSASAPELIASHSAAPSAPHRPPNTDTVTYWYGTHYRTPIEPAALDHVFDRFWRADKVRSRAEGGAGLGLSLAAQIVKRHGGTISVSSQAGCGTTFTVQLSAAPRQIS